eukprot:Sdes_comp20349_c0_seq1m14120
MTTKKTPLSLEDILQKKKREEEANSRPKFLSKEQRAKLALEKRAEEVEKMRKSVEKAKQEEIAQIQHEKEAEKEAEKTKKSSESSLQAKDTFRSSRTNADSHRRETRGREENSDRRNEHRGEEKPEIRLRRRSESKCVQDEGGERAAGENRDEFNGSEERSEAELKAIRERYLGATKSKKLVRRLREKRIDFAWSEKDDTSNDHNPLYRNVHEASFFGRGHLAGIDLEDQKQHYSKFYSGYLKERQGSAEYAEYRERKRSDHVKRKEPSRLEGLHWSEKSLAEMTERDWRIFKEDFNIATRGGNIPHPLRNWKEANLPSIIMKTLHSLGYKDPSPIQRQAIPIGLQNRDIIGVAETGSGKTAAFVIPMLVWIHFNNTRTMEVDDGDEGPFAIVLAPTRELAQQIERETIKFAVHLGIRTVSVVGGLSREDQGMRLRQGCDIVIATPGRLKDVLESRYLVLNRCTYIVLDEADRMIEMNFEQDVKDILDFMPVSNMKPEHEDVIQDITKGVDKKYRQTVMFTATMPPAVERIAKTYLRRPATVYIGNVGKVTDNVEQIVYMVSDNEKRNKLGSIIASIEAFPVIIFVNHKKSTEFISRSLDKEGYRTVTLHGGKSQEQRESSLNQLKAGEKDILVATDVAGRGIDIKNVSHVINYDMAKNIEDYTHRIGRTGRAGKRGVA